MMQRCVARCFPAAREENTIDRLRERYGDLPPTTVRDLDSGEVFTVDELESRTPHPVSAFDLAAVSPQHTAKKPAAEPRAAPHADAAVQLPLSANTEPLAAPPAAAPPPDDTWRSTTTPLETTDLPVHVAVWRDDLAALNSLIAAKADLERRDARANTPLHLAIALQRVEACRLLVAAGAWCVAKNVGGWYATQEACRLDDAPLLESMVRSAMRHAFSKFEEKLPRLQAALVALPDFELELHWQFSSWIPFASKLLPSDTLTVRKRGAALRSDYTLAAFEGLGGWERGAFSQLLLPSGEVTALDHGAKCKDRGLRCRLLDPTPEQLELALTNLKLRRSKSSKTHFDRAEVVPRRRMSAAELRRHHDATEYELRGLRVEARMQPRVDAAGDVPRDADAAERAAAERTGDSSRDAAIRARARFAPLASIGRKLMDVKVTAAEGGVGARADAVGFREYFGDALEADGGAEEAAVVHSVGHETMSKTFDGVQLLMSESFPLDKEAMLPIFEVLSFNLEQFEQIQGFWEATLPAGFPVRFSVPVFGSALRSDVTFGRCELGAPDASLFEVPPDYADEGFKFFGERMAERNRAKKS